jgi:hypothetical protein
MKNACKARFEKSQNKHKHGTIWSPKNKEIAVEEAASRCNRSFLFNQYDCHIKRPSSGTG